MKDKNAENLIPIPCHQTWEDMGKDEIMTEGHSARMCDECQHHVHDISNMSSQQIIDLRTKLNQQGQKLCGMVRQPKEPNPSRLQRFSLACITAMAPIALVACGGNAPPGVPHSYPPAQQLQEQQLQQHPFPPGVLGKVAAPPRVAGTVVAPRNL